MTDQTNPHYTVTIITTDGNTVTTMTAQSVTITAGHNDNLRGTYTLDIDTPKPVSSSADTAEAALVRTIGMLANDLRETTERLHEADKTSRLNALRATRLQNRAIRLQNRLNRHNTPANKQLRTARAKAWDEGYRAARPANPINPYHGDTEDDPYDTL